MGHAECLRQVRVEGAANWKANRLDLSDLLTPGSCEYGRAIPGADCPHSLPQMAPDLELDRTLDATLLVPHTAPAREHLEPVRFRADIDNVNRCVGTLLGSRVTRRHPEGLPEGAITVDCEGSAGQSFGAFLPAGVTLGRVRRRQRLLWQGPLGRRARGASAGGGHVQVRRERHRGERGPSTGPRAAAAS